MLERLLNFVRQVIHRVLPYKAIEQAEHIDTSLSPEMLTALDLWHDMYTNKAPWLAPDGMVSMNLASFVCSEIARQILLEMTWDITGADPANGGGEAQPNARSEYLKAEFEKLFCNLREQLEKGCAAGGLSIKPYPKDGHIYFDFTPDWEMLPVAFGDQGELSEVIFLDTFQEGKTYYTRLERHQLVPEGVRITQRAFKSNNAQYTGTEIQLAEVPLWADLQPEVLVRTPDRGQMFGWYRVALANTVDTTSPMGAAVFSKAVDAIREADKQYSRILWEYEGSELAVDVDPTVLRPIPGAIGPDGRPTLEVPQLNRRLFRGVNLGKDETYNVFSPAIRDGSLLNGLDTQLKLVEDLTGLSRGTLSTPNAEAKTATELKILKQRSYATIADNQKALERCLKDVVRAMDLYATLYNLAPAGEYQVSFTWDDSIITDSEQQMGERMTLVNTGLMSKKEFRMWYFNETDEQAQAALQGVLDEQMQTQQLLAALQGMTGGAEPGAPSGDDTIE